MTCLAAALTPVSVLEPRRFASDFGTLFAAPEVTDRRALSQAVPGAAGGFGGTYVAAESQLTLQPAGPHRPHHFTTSGQRRLDFRWRFGSRPPKNEWRALTVGHRSPATIELGGLPVAPAPGPAPRRPLITGECSRKTAGVTLTGAEQLTRDVAASQLSQPRAMRAAIPSGRPDDRRPGLAVAAGIQRYRRLGLRVACSASRQAEGTAVGLTLADNTVVSAPASPASLPGQCHHLDRVRKKSPRHSDHATHDTTTVNRRRTRSSNATVNLSPRPQHLKQMPSLRRRYRRFGEANSEGDG